MACPSVTFSPIASTLTSAAVGIPYTQTMTQTGQTGTVTFSVSPALPTGLGINMSNGTISGKVKWYLLLKTLII